MSSFYCQNLCGDIDFSIDEWNEAFKYCNDNNLSEEETKKILRPGGCKEQCFACMAIVGERRNKTNSIVLKDKSMRIVKNNHTQPATPETNIQKCRWCNSELEVTDDDIKRGDVMYSQREIDHNVKGFDCPCCEQFTPLFNPAK